MNIMGLISSKMEEIREAVIENIQEGLENSMSYEAYQELIAELLEKGESTTKGGSEALVPFSELNLRRMSRWDRRFEIEPEDRKSTRLNSSHVAISYAVFCLK